MPKRIIRTEEELLALKRAYEKAYMDEYDRLSRLGLDVVVDPVTGYDTAQRAGQKARRRELAKQRKARGMKG